MAARKQTLPTVNYGSRSDLRPIDGAEGRWPAKSGRWQPETHCRKAAIPLNLVACTN